MTSLVFSKEARADATLRVCDFVRRRYPVKTAANFEADTGIEAYTFRKWDAGIASPSFVNLLTCISVYGPEILHAALGSYAPDWLRDDVRERELAELRASRAETSKKIAALEAR